MNERSLEIISISRLRFFVRGFNKPMLLSKKANLPISKTINLKIKLISFNFYGYLMST